MEILLFPGSEDICCFSVWKNSFGSSFLFTISYFMNPSPQGPLCGGPTWTSSMGQGKYTSKPVKIQLFVNGAVRNQSWSKENYPSCLTYAVWKCCSPMLALSAALWGGSRRCHDSAEAFALISVCLVLCSSETWGLRLDLSPAWPSSQHYALMNF